jgi:hypothetical protein
MREQAMLMQLIEGADRVQPDWQDALDRAGHLGRQFPHRTKLLRPQRVAIIVAVVLATIYTVAAVAAGRPRVGPVYWLFDRSNETYPVYQVPRLEGWAKLSRGTFDVDPVRGWHAVKVVPVLRGWVAGHRFEMSAFTLDGQFSVGFSGGRPSRAFHGTNVPAVGDGAVGVAGIVRGLPVPKAVGGVPFHAPDPEDMHWVSVTLGIARIDSSGGGTGPKWVFGVANPDVARIELRDANDGTAVSVPTFSGPPGYPIRFRIWVAALRLDKLVHIVVPLDRNGKELERWELPMAL